ncbi:MAG TPA: Fe-S-containing protein [Terriglobia bacterium]|nr:Fe-S-containing protein [Terriglobia bacterium]
MLESLVITLREGVEAALVVGIVLGYLRKTGRSAWARTVYLALGLAVLASLALGAWLHRLNVSELGDAYEGGLMLVAAVFVASLVWWMWRTGKRMKGEIEQKLQRLSDAPGHGASTGLFFFVFLMVFREGIETVLFLAAVSLRTTGALLEFTGAVAGLALAVGFGVAFFKGSLRVNLPRFFRITTVVLFAISIQLLVTGVHELSEAQVLPSSPREMALVGPIVNNDLLFIVLVIAICLFLVTAEHVGKNAPKPAALERLPAPARRKILAVTRRERFWKLAAAGMALAAIVLISAEIVYAHAAQARDVPQGVALTGSEVRIPVSELGDHGLHHFALTVAGREVRFIAILDVSNTVRAAFDACAVCGTQGYYQRGQMVICRNCGAAINVPTMGHGGGCNPIPFDPPYLVEGDTLVIPGAALEAAAYNFTTVPGDK